MLETPNGLTCYRVVGENISCISAPQVWQKAPHRRAAWLSAAGAVEAAERKARWSEGVSWLHPKLWWARKMCSAEVTKNVVLVQSGSPVESCGRRFFTGMNRVIFERHVTVLPDVRRHILVYDFVCLSRVFFSAAVPDSNAGFRSKAVPTGHNDVPQVARREKSCLVSVGVLDAVQGMQCFIDCKK